MKSKKINRHAPMDVPACEHDTDVIVAALMTLTDLCEHMAYKGAHRMYGGAQEFVAAMATMMVDMKKETNKKPRKRQVKAKKKATRKAGVNFYGGELPPKKKTTRKAVKK